MEENRAYKKNLSLVKNNFNSHALDYDDCAILQQAVGERLIERLDLIKKIPETVLDLGCGTGAQQKSLKRKYDKATIFAMDMAPGMVKKASAKKTRFFNRLWPVCGKAEQTPLKNESLNMVFSNLMLQWCNDLDVVMGEMSRVLRPEGLLIFSSFGPDTLKELRDSWAKVDDYIHVNAFIDMHDMGDAMVRAGFSNPVMEAETITLTYDDIFGLMKDLKMIGAQNTNQGRKRGLTSKGDLEGLVRAYEAYRHEGRLPATYEVVYGHAWRGQARNNSGGSGGEFNIPVSAITRTRK
jgi:malonyl-CoA O-methyltransferase